MHRIHSIEVSEATSGEYAIIIKLSGELDNDMEPILRLEFDKTLVRERRGGVILDLRSVCVLGGTVLARISSFASILGNDGIRFVVVSPRNIDCSALILGISDKFDAMVPSVRVAKEIIGIH